MIYIQSTASTLHNTQDTYIAPRDIDTETYSTVRTISTRSILRDPFLRLCPQPAENPGGPCMLAPGRRRFDAWTPARLGMPKARTQLAEE
jgi:hypothetical protein